MSLLSGSRLSGPPPAVSNTTQLPSAGPIYQGNDGSLPFRIAQQFCRFVFTTFFDLKVWGVNHVPRAGGVLLISNHQSFLDPVLLGVALPRRLSYMARSGLFKHPAFSWLIRSLGAFPVREGGSAAGAIKETIDRLQEGRVLTIYPEGKRTDDGLLCPFQNGIALVVRKSKVPIVPAAIWGSFESYPTGTSYPSPRPIRVLYGPPLMLHDQKPDVIVRTLQEHVQALYDQLRAMNPTAEEQRLWAIERRDRERASRRRK